VLGAGPDAMPLVEIAGLMNWHVTVLDHRPAYAVAERFPRAQRVALNPAGELTRQLQSAQYDAAVVMSHHLLSDQAYLDALAAHESIPYIGLLGPAPRRTRLMQELGERSRGLDGRLHGPIGLDIGAKTPEAIALAIVAEIQAVLAGRPGGPFSKQESG
jgi:xanthine dehydrogenase accessory factor